VHLQGKTHNLKKVTEDIIALYKQGTEYKKMAKGLNNPRNTIGSIVHKFKVKEMVVKLPDLGRKKISFQWPQPDF